MGFDLEYLRSCARAVGVELEEAQCRAFEQYARLLVEYNEKVNLTAITDPREIILKHFADSIAPLGRMALPRGARVVDVGTGAGFPAVPMKIVRPDLQVTLMDSLGKRLAFLQELVGLLGLSGVRTVHARAEQAGIDPAFRGQFDLATARAVAQLRVLCEYCLPLVKVGGSFWALKGPDCREEVQQARQAAALLGGGEPEAFPLALPGAEGRTLVVIEKKSQTPAKYPRQRVKLTQKPL